MSTRTIGVDAKSRWFSVSIYLYRFTCIDSAFGTGGKRLLSNINYRTGLHEFVALYLPRLPVDEIPSRILCESILPQFEVQVGACRHFAGIPAPRDRFERADPIASTFQ